MATNPAPLQQRYTELREQAEAYASRGQFRLALGVLTEALEIAEALGSPETRDRAIVNRARLAIELSPGDKEPVQELGRVLLRARDPETGFRAALHLARVHHLRKDSQKAMFYGRKACERAEQTSCREFIARAKNELGLSLLASSYFVESVEEFEAALAVLDPSPSLDRAIVLDNLGYACVVQDRFEVGFPCLFEALRTVRGGRSKWLEMNVRISLSFAFLELSKTRHALRHGRLALAIADQTDDAAAVKSALFLLGEASKQSGDEFAARRCFSRLQEAFYPDSPYLADMLMFIDARTLINLKA
jgi:tetratricopeptide (TPR) repeat protein